MNKKFIFLYPQEEIFEYQIDKGSVFFKDPHEKEKDNYFLPRIQSTKTEEEKERVKAEAKKDRADSFRPVYAAKLNSCIYWRYRRNSFSIVYAVLDDCQVSDVIKLQPENRIIKVGMDSQTHRTMREDGTYPYPDQDYILNQISPVGNLVVAGFHMWDCVEKLARRAYERGVNTLVDEDLTEFFAGRLKDKDFRIKTYLTYNPRLRGESHFDIFMEARKNKPWLYQEY